MFEAGKAIWATTQKEIAQISCKPFKMPCFHASCGQKEYATLMNKMDVRSSNKTTIATKKDLEKCQTFKVRLVMQVNMNRVEFHSKSTASTYFIFWKDFQQKTTTKFHTFMKKSTFHAFILLMHVKKMSSFRWTSGIYAVFILWTCVFKNSLFSEFLCVFSIFHSSIHIMKIAKIKTNNFAFKLMLFRSQCLF